MICLSKLDVTISACAIGASINVDAKLNTKIGQSPDYVNRIFHAPGSTESIIDVFAQHGFTEWGGNWHEPIDYQHFQIPRAVAEDLVKEKF